MKVETFGMSREEAIAWYRARLGIGPVSAEHWLKITPHYPVTAVNNRYLEEDMEQTIQSRRIDPCHKQKKSAATSPSTSGRKKARGGMNSPSKDNGFGKVVIQQTKKLHGKSQQLSTSAATVM